MNRAMNGAMNRAKRERYAAAGSIAVHLLVLAVIIIGPIGKWFAEKIQTTSLTEIAFRASSGGSAANEPTGEPQSRAEQPREEEPEPRTPVPPRQLNFDELETPDLPEEPLLENAFSPQAVEVPRASSNVGGVPPGVRSTSPSGSARMGLVTVPGKWDTDPVLIFEPDPPPYPPLAREKMIQGEVILQVLVKVDGSTEVVRVIKSLPYCVDAARENARLWRWKPALKDGKPVEALGIITVTFDIFAQKGKKTQLLR